MPTWAPQGGGGEPGICAPPSILAVIKSDLKRLKHNSICSSNGGNYEEYGLNAV
jgi:hypothetical protein